MAIENFYNSFFPVLGIKTRFNSTTLLPESMPLFVYYFLTSILLVVAVACILLFVLLSTYVIRSLYETFLLRHVRGEPWLSVLRFASFRNPRPHRSNRERLARTRHYASCGYVHREYMHLTPVLITTHPADVIQVLVSPEFERPARMLHALNHGLPGSLFTMSREAHRCARAHVRNGFSARSLPVFHAAARETFSELLRKLGSAADGTLDVSPNVTKEFPNFEYVIDIVPLISESAFRIATQVALGTNMDDKKRRLFLKLLDKTLSYMSFEYLYYPFSSIVKLCLQNFSGTRCVRSMLECICRNMLEDRFQKRRRLGKSLSRQKSDASGSEQNDGTCADLLDVVIAIHNYNGDDDCSDAVSQIMLFTMASTYTTMSTIVWAIYELSRKENRSICDELCEELDGICQKFEIKDEDTIPLEIVPRLTFLRKVWKETLRLHPTAFGNPQKATRDIVLNGSGVYVPRGAQVIPGSWATQTDERYYEHGDRFNPSRWGDENEPSRADVAPNGAYVPFSAGANNCAGQFFAEFEGIITLAEIFRKFLFSLPCADDHIVSYNYWFEMAQYDPEDSGSSSIGLPVCVTRRKSRTE